MKKLRNKVFFTIFSIFTLFVLSILVFVNYQNYKVRYDNTMDTLIRMSDDRRIEKRELIPDRPKKEIDVRRIFLDRVVYTITLDDNGNFVSLTSHTEESVDEEKIIKLARSIIRNHKDNLKIGNLYISDYSYSFSMDKKMLTIVSNADIKGELINFLLSSILIGILSEVIIIFISLVLTKWIIKPVEISFDKQNQFIADASHELKTPISVILASLSAYEKDNDKKWITNIKSETDRMSKLVISLLDLASLENSKKEYEEHNFSKIIESSILTFESILFDEKIKLEYNIEDDIMLKCNPLDIKQLMSIILDNAIKHSIFKKKIIINLESDKDDVVIYIKNRGKSISKDDEDRIFERFYRVDESRNRDSNRYGLGLSIAKKIVENHNGKISVSSRNGFTTFKIILNRR